MVTDTSVVAAVEYAARGWRVLAIVPGSKVPIADPMQPHGSRSATADAEIIRELWSRHPNANVAIATGPESGVDVIDYDGPHAPALAKNRALVAPSTRTVRTPRGGYHVYVIHDAAIPNRAALLADSCAPKPCQIDCRSAGGYVLAPPSVVGGGTYEVVRDLPVAPWPQFIEFCRVMARPKLVTRTERPGPQGGGLIARIKAAWTVEEVAERLGAHLRGQGDHLKAKCPLHGEREGYAFVIWTHEQKWRCFGKCNTGGDVVDLYRIARERQAV